MMVISDAAVVSRIRDGESEAYSVLFERYHARCARLALRLLGDPDEAADAVQDAFIRAYLSLDSYQERDRFGSWLLCIVANRCRSAAAGARRRTTTATEWVRAQQETASTDKVREGDHALAHQIDNALESLPASTRSVVLSKYGDGLTYEEISADTGVAVSALKMRVARGSAQLRRSLIGAGITVATVAIVIVSHGREVHKPRSAALVACDTLRAIMHDTLSPAARDSILPAHRCNDMQRKPSAVGSPRAPAHPPQEPEF